LGSGPLGHSFNLAPSRNDNVGFTLSYKHKWGS
jgi:hypothetical protein